MTDHDNVDLGSGHRMTYYVMEDGGAEIGVIVWHKTPAGEDCAGSVHFDVPAMREWLKKNDQHRPLWTVASVEPLTLSPSILCSCGDHGWIRDGRWVPA